VSAIDIQSQTVTTTIDQDLQDGPNGIAITPTGQYIYVTNEYDESVSVIDAATKPVVFASIPVGKYPQGVAVAPNGEYAYVANESSDSVSIIDTDTNTVIDTLLDPSFDGPTGVAFSNDGKVAYVTNTFNDTLSVIDTGSGEVIESIDLDDPVDPVYPSPVGVAVAPVGTPNAGYVYVAGLNSGEVLVVDPTNYSVVDRITGFLYPKGLAVNPITGDVYVGQLGAVSVITPAGTISVDQQPIAIESTLGGVAVTPDGSSVYLAGPGESGVGAGEVAVFDTATTNVTYVTVGDGPSGVAIGPL
jgi:YVTN family beta-propeller protein